MCNCLTGYTGDGYSVYTDQDESSFRGDDNPCPSKETGGFCVNTFVHDANPESAGFEGYKCVCHTKKGVVDGPDLNVHGPTTCFDINE